ncbi:MAG: PEP-CTERM sorting domain-containing protein [Verrucomicrobiota bacterium]
MKTRLIQLTCGLALLGALPSAQATVVLDNTSAEWNTGGEFSAVMARDLALVFKTGSTGGTIDALSFALIASGPSTTYPTLTFSAYIYQCGGVYNNPGGAALATQNGLTATFTGEPGWTSQLFSYDAAALGGLTSFELAADTSYALVLGNNNDPNRTFYWAMADPPTYTLNEGYTFLGTNFSFDNGATWDRTSSGAPPIASISMTAIPEPTTAAILGLVTSGLMLRRRKRIMR